MSDLHSELDAWAKSAFTRDLFCGATPLSDTLRAASARIATLTAERDALAEQAKRARDDALTLLMAEHAEWSARQFGNVSAVGPAKHLSKEALEVAADPHDVIEHADCWMLLWDMQRRAGISDAQLAAAIAEKLAINKARKWPEAEEGEAREHMKGGAE